MKAYVRKKERKKTETNTRINQNEIIRNEISVYSQRKVKRCNEEQEQTKKKNE